MSHTMKLWESHRAAPMRNDTDINKPIWFLFTPKFGRRIAGTQKLPRLCHQGIGFLQIAPADNDKGYDRRRDKACWTLQKGKY